MSLRVAFLHLELSIGGAENLIVNAAKGLQSCGHEVEIFTTYHDKSRAFKETSDGTLKVSVFGSWIPADLLGGRFTILMSLVRMWYVCFMIWVLGLHADVVITDQISATNIWVRLFGIAREKLIFYCHFPDALLCTERTSSMKRHYRKLFDSIEEYSTVQLPNVILANSNFTANCMRKVFPALEGSKIGILYPPVERQVLVGVDSRPPPVESITDPANLFEDISNGVPFFLSLNRYDRNKDIGLVIESFADAFGPSSGTVLVISGVLHLKTCESLSYFEELIEVTKKLSVYDRVLFLKNVSDDTRMWLLANAAAVVYSPQKEHFGIVPCEAMAAGTPVIAWNNGGPTESILHNETGYLCDSRADFASAMKRIINLPREDIERMQTACKTRVEKFFSLDSFTSSLNIIIQS